METQARLRPDRGGSGYPKIILCPREPTRAGTVKTTSRFIQTFFIPMSEVLKALHWLT